jgi:hypothetical protein
LTEIRPESPRRGEFDFAKSPVNQGDFDQIRPDGRLPSGRGEPGRISGQPAIARVLDLKPSLRSARREICTGLLRVAPSSSRTLPDSVVVGSARQVSRSSVVQTDVPLCRGLPLGRDRHVG